VLAWILKNTNSFVTQRHWLREASLARERGLDQLIGLFLDAICCLVVSVHLRRVPDDGELETPPYDAGAIRLTPRPPSQRNATSTSHLQLQTTCLIVKALSIVCNGL
jgi:hypothetical protein